MLKCELAPDIVIINISVRFYQIHFLKSAKTVTKFFPKVASVLKSKLVTYIIIFVWLYQNRSINPNIATVTLALDLKFWIANFFKILHLIFL